MAANEESDPSVILNGFWVTLVCFYIFHVISAFPQRGNSHLLTFKYALPYSYGLEKSILRLLNHVRG